MIPVYIDLNAQQAYDVAHGADSFRLEVLPDIKPGSVLWLREPWRIYSSKHGTGLTNGTTCSYEYQAEQLGNRNWLWADSWRDSSMMPPSAIRLRRRCTLVKQVKRVGFNRRTQNSHYWYVGIGSLEDDNE